MAKEDSTLFQSLPAPLRERLLADAVRHQVTAHSVIFEQGEVPNFQLLLLTGTVQLFGRTGDGREVLIETVRGPEFIIPAAVTTGAPYLMRARTAETSELLLIRAEAFRQAIAEDPVLAQAVIRSLSLQFRRMVRQVKNVKLRSSTERVGCYILALRPVEGRKDEVLLPYEKRLVASELGMTRESFSRALHALEAEGIKVKGQTIEIWDRDRLAAIAHPDPLIDEEI